MTLRVLLGALTLCLAGAASAAPVTIHTTVSAMDNLYYTDWGHWWTEPVDGEGADGALNDGLPAQAVDWAFQSGDRLDILASGWVIDDGPLETDAAGNYRPDAVCQPDCTFKDGHLRNLPVYSLIGIWSTSAEEIVPLTDDPLTLTAPFYIGLEAALVVPESSGALYLFLAENDGHFADNSGYYDVRIDLTPVPLPGAALLMASALGALVSRARRRS